MWKGNTVTFRILAKLRSTLNALAAPAGRSRPELVRESLETAVIKRSIFEHEADVADQLAPAEWEDA